jgi:hypothetical protein
MEAPTDHAAEVHAAAAGGRLRVHDIPLNR